MNDATAPLLIPDSRVAKRYSVTLRTLDRWDRRPELGFPPPRRIRNRKYRVLHELDIWDRENARRVAGMPD
jgi:hypothetical protein